MKTILVLIALSAILCLEQDVQAQQNEGANPPCLLIAESLLSPLEGSWDVHWTYRTAPGQFAQLQGTSRIQKDLQGCALVEHFEGVLRGIAYSAITMISQKEEGQFDRVRIDSEHGSFSQSSGHIEGDSLVFEWQRDLGTRVLRTRHYFLEITDSTFTVAFYLSGREGAPWELVERRAYRRVEEQE